MSPFSLSSSNTDGNDLPSRDRLKSDSDLLSEQFRSFIDEVLRAPARVAEMRETDPALAAQSMNRYLLRLLELQTAQIERDVSRLELDNVGDARYLKVALADELLLSLPWLGRDHWTGHLLESALYQSNIAGDLVFQRIDALLAEREPSRRKVARLYLLAIAMGFQGRYRSSGQLSFPGAGSAMGSKNGQSDAPADGPATVHDPRLDAYRRELFQFVFQRRPDLGGRDRVLDESAYAYTLAHLAPRKLPALSRWLSGVLIAIVALLAISEILWLSTTWDVRSALNGQFTADGANR
ncbi:DotU family type IV/VI secretion system protein [Robbsia sp. KACC 23696]|uniref:DotU family type IV/VI secretion system protein n=1 Tax=Robbsia sp. KACC 23696 TaxID=3149231 RepID=UPI00325BDA47